MLRMTCMVCLVSVLLSAGTRAPGAPKVEFSDAGVKEAIKKTTDYLWSLQDPATGAWAPYGKGPGGNYHPLGPTALAAYALLESGVKIQSEPRMKKALAALESLEIEGTYSLGLRANVWLAAAKQNKAKYLPLLRKDTKFLVESTADGSYGYVCKGQGKSRGDNSNAQYGLLGVWAGARASIEIPRQYWLKVLVHWINCQCPDGGWDYRGNASSRPTMAAAGIASLFVCYDNLLSDASSFLNCRPSKQMELAQLPIQRGLKWFDTNYAKTVGGHPNGYYLYGVERVGLASGYKYFGKLDWYKMGATKLLRSQNGGSWGSPVNTAFGLLFLIRGRNAVAFNKLQFTGDWNNRPRDLASLTRWIGKSFERTVNWQIVNFKTPVSEWHDAPILYISGAKAPQFSEDDLAKLRRYVWQGGTIFGVTECNGSAFKREIRKVYKKLFPAYELVPLGRSHGVYSAHYPLPGVPRLYAISNGVRPLVFHTDVDLPKSWQLQTTSTQKSAFQAPANIFMYVTDQGKLRFRGTTHWPDEPAGRTVRTVRLARLAHGGNCNPEPLAYTCLRRRLMAATGVRLDVVGPIEIAALGEARASVATMTGTGEFNLTDAEKKALKQFVEAGGTLVLDAAGGAKMEPDPKTKINRPVGFAASAEQLITDLFGAKALRLLSSQAPVLLLDGLEIGRVAYRRRTRARMPGVRVPNLRVVAVGDRPAVIYSPEDITAGLIGYASSEVDGYQPDSAYRLMRNIILAAPRLSPPVPSSSTRPESGGAMPADGKTLRPSDGGLFVDR